jgi:hypothetical protein
VAVAYHLYELQTQSCWVFKCVEASRQFWSWRLCGRCSASNSTHSRPTSLNPFAAMNPTGLCGSPKKCGRDSFHSNLWPLGPTRLKTLEVYESFFSFLIVSVTSYQLAVCNLNTHDPISSKYRAPASLFQILFGKQTPLTSIYMFRHNASSNLPPSDNQ